MSKARDSTMGTSGKRKQRTGFKSDRAARYKAKVDAQLGKKSMVKPPQQPTTTKAVVFDEEDRKKTLLSYHKNKNERRVKAMTEAKRKMSKENSKMRRELREEARSQYNSYAAVPILPNYTFRFPEYGTDGVDRRPAAAVVEGTTLHTSTEGSAHTVDVAPLRQAMTQHANAAPTGSMRQQYYLKDLPASVAARVQAVAEKDKGNSQMKKRVNAMTTLAKIKKIQKHSRKGHGKKKASGKRKNR